MSNPDGFALLDLLVFMELESHLVVEATEREGLGDFGLRVRFRGDVSLESFDSVNFASLHPEERKKGSSPLG